MSKKLGIKIEDIVDLYNQGQTPIQIAEKYGCCTANICRRLKKAGIKVTRDYSKARHIRTGRYQIDLDFFKQIDTEEKAYFLGVMYSDGSVSEDQFYLKLKDEDVVRKFKEALKCENPIKHNEIPYYNYILQISCREMCQDLINWGCTINKTRTITFPNIDKSLYRHFIRGFFDGDGCIRVGVTKSKCHFDIVSASRTFLLQLKEILNPIASHIGISKEKSYDIWHLRCGGKQVQQILDWLYKDSTVYMQRKYFKYQLISSL